MKKRGMAMGLALVLGTSLAPGSAWAAESDWQTQQVHKDAAGVPAFVSGVLSEQLSGPLETAAVEWLEVKGNFFKIANAKDSLLLKRSEQDALGMTHLRYQQVKDGVPVDGAELLVHVDAEGVVRTVNGHFDAQTDQAELDVKPGVSAEQALAAAKQEVSAPEQLTYEPTTDLVVYARAGKPLLAYKVEVTYLTEQPARWQVYIDAQTGETVHKVNALAEAEGMADRLRPSKGVGIGLKGQHRILDIAHGKTDAAPGTQFYLADLSQRGMQGIYTYDFGNRWPTSVDDWPGELFRNKSAAWKDPYHRAAVDAHYNAGLVYQYFLREHGRNSIDGNGMAIISSVHFGQNFGDAFWDGGQMTYGDGDGLLTVDMTSALDVAAHEMAHGVTEHSAGLIYEGQPGALNEALSDIFGVLVDAEDWDIGEDMVGPERVAIGRTSLRSLENPSKYLLTTPYWPYGDGSGTFPSHMRQYYTLPLSMDFGGVHINSSIINHAAYLTGEQIGKRKLGKIYYRMVTTYLMPTSDFQDARHTAIQAATDLYGADSAEVRAVIAGYDGVGITD